MRVAPPTIVHFCYGDQAVYDQTTFSILSLLHKSRGEPGARVVVYCDRPDWFAPLPIETQPVGADLLEKWLGPSDYHHRRKTCVIIDALERFGGPVLFLDSDTYWRRAATSLLRRIGPGRACFHIKEGFLLSTGTPSDEALVEQLRAHRYSTPTGGPVIVDATTPMWNTGVVGVDPEDLPLMREALALSDAIWADADPVGAYGAKIHHAEQFAMGHAFRRSRIGQAADHVHHYWTRQAKTKFGAILPELVSSGLADLSPSNLTAVYARRQRGRGTEAAKERFKMSIRRLALGLRVPVRGVRRSIA